MKTHFCRREQTIINFEGTCNWCGENESNVEEQPQFYTHSVVLSDRLAWVTWAFVALVLTGFAVLIAYVLGKLI